MHNAETTRALIDCLATRHGVARYAAAERLAAVGTPGEIPLVLDVISAATDDPDLRNALAGTLSRIRERFGLPANEGGLTVAALADSGLALVEQLGGEPSKAATEEVAVGVDTT